MPCLWFRAKGPPFSEIRHNTVFRVQPVALLDTLCFDMASMTPIVGFAADRSGSFHRDRRNTTAAADRYGIAHPYLHEEALKSESAAGHRRIPPRWVWPQHSARVFAATSFFLFVLPPVCSLSHTHLYSCPIACFYRTMIPAFIYRGLLRGWNQPRNFSADSRPPAMYSRSDRHSQRRINAFTHGNTLPLRRRVSTGRSINQPTVVLNGEEAVVYDQCNFDIGCHWVQQTDARGPFRSDAAAP